MEVQRLGNETAGATQYNYWVKLTHADLTETTDDTAQTIELLDVEDGHIVTGVDLRLGTPFEDAGDAAFNTTAVTVGDGGDVDRFVASTELNVNGTEITTAAGTGTRHAYTGTDTVDIVFSAMAAKALNDIDTGELIVLVTIVDTTQFEEPNH